jgi:NAD-dependent deacetylase
MNLPKITKDDNIVIITGAGISAESGIQTFRDSDGLWANHRIEDVATPRGFKENPILVWNFYKERYYQSINAEPNSGHLALYEMEKYFTNFTIITQNVDGLHTRAGNKNVYEMHGRLNSCFCINCYQKYNLSEIDLNQTIPLCKNCYSYLRPDIVWFEETPYYLTEISNFISKATIFMSIGTSGEVYPAAYLIYEAKKNGAVTIGINLTKPSNIGSMDYFIEGKSGDILPEILKSIKK